MQRIHSYSQRREYCSSSVVFFPQPLVWQCQEHPLQQEMGPALELPSSMAIGVNKANTIWCSARTDVKLRARICCQLFSGSTVMAHSYLLSAEDSRVAMTCTWSIMLAVEVSSMLRGTEFFISRDHHLLLLGIIHVLPITIRGIGIKAWKF